MFCILPKHDSPRQISLSSNILKGKRGFEDISRPNESKLPKTNVYAIEKQSVELISLFDVLKKIYNLKVIKRLSK